jgi:protoporphyrinogen IX oxidase
MIGTYVFGWWSFFLNFGYYIIQPWMWLKLIAVGLLTIYHLWCQSVLNKQKKGIFNHSSFRLRLMNELATLFLVAIVFLVVVKSTSGLIWGVLGLVLFGAILMSLVSIYKKIREKKGDENSTPVP